VDESRLVLFEGCTAFPLPLCYLIHNSLDTLSIGCYRGSGNPRYIVVNKRDCSSIPVYSALYKVCVKKKEQHWR
jgi:hypothetical protein